MLGTWWARLLNNIAGVLAPQIPTPTGDFESISTQSLTGATSTITFSSIPSTYKHLHIRGLILNSSTQNNLAFQFNSSGGTAYSAHQVQGNGSTTAANASTSSPYAYLEGLVDPSNTNAFVGVYDILDYANTNKYKTLRGLSGQDRNGAGTVQLTSGLWQSTSAITSITITLPGYTMGNYTTFALYGIKG